MSERASYLKVTNHDSPYQHMFCSQCSKPALQEYWEWTEMEEDELQCPNCFSVIKIGQWIDGVPEEKPKQKCLMCDGNGSL